MTDTPKITDQQIADAAVAPQSVSVDGVSVQSRQVKDLIDAQDRTANNSAAVSPRRGLLFTKLIPGSARGQ